LSSVDAVLSAADTSSLFQGCSMLGLDADRRPPRAFEWQPYLRGLESALDRLGRAPGPAADALATSIAARLSDIAERLQGHATRTGSEANRLGGRLAETGRDTVTLFSKEVSANPLAAVGAALGIGAIIGIALMRKPKHQARTAVRKSRKGSTR
jgi:ElaB/YqjD/DUF883 family membrane-anchored ribosome-binding protein